MLIYKVFDKELKYCYIGKTVRNFEERVKEHLRDLNKKIHHNTFLQNIYNKNPDAVLFEVVEDGIGSIEELNSKEIYYIEKLGNVNIHKGGLGGDNLTHHPMRVLLAEQNKKRNIERARDRYTQKFGRISQYSKEGNLIRTCESIKDFDKFGFKSTQIMHCLIGKLKSHKGFVFFCEYNIPICVKPFLKTYLTDASRGVSRGSLVSRVGEEGKQKKIDTLKKAAKDRSIRIGKFDSEGNQISTYSSVLEAARKEKDHQGTISNYLKSGKLNRKGFIWRKLE